MNYRQLLGSARQHNRHTNDFHFWQSWENKYFFTWVAIDISKYTDVVVRWEIWNLIRPMESTNTHTERQRKRQRQKKNFIANQNKSHSNFLCHKHKSDGKAAAHDLSMNEVHKLMSSCYSFLSLLSSSLFIIVAVFLLWIKLLNEIFVVLISM